MPIALSTRTMQVAGVLFTEPERSRIVERLVREASENIPGHAEATPEQMDRIRFSIMKLILQHPKNEENAFHLATVDWRDLFMSAGFAYSTSAHECWYREVMKRQKG